ncbi:hypothetical protein LCER1_G006728 [Lachnellula cervina]|uniref:Ecp2 effector protein domain-containing protein n=1 Tax=Lachnellula cervina TaxID=1316786 RepID=A0A7D8UL77_9HELO|nr:hypothetical protein LCER1_G006728 [Lachnellula cervina]
MHFSTILTLFSITAITGVTQAAGLGASNANHLSKYTSDACDDKDKYDKWKSTMTCKCLLIEIDAASIYTDHEATQSVFAYSDGNCNDFLGEISAKQCINTATLFSAGRIVSLWFSLPGVCNPRGVGDIAAGAAADA